MVFLLLKGCVFFYARRRSDHLLITFKIL